MEDDSNPCDDGNACTTADICQHGACVGANPIRCGLTPVTYGFPNNQGAQDFARPYWFGGFQLAVYDTITITHLGLVSFAHEGNAEMALYSDASGHPDRLIAYTRAVTLTDDRIAIPVVTPTVVEPGLYWIMAMYDNSVPIGVAQAGRLNFWTHDFVFGQPPGSTFNAQQNSQGFWFNYFVKGTTGSLAVCHVPGVCDPATGQCDDPVAPDGTVCGDGDPCTESDQCQSGACVGGPPPSCDDGNLCTDDSCLAGVGCQHARNSAPCDDGNDCTDIDVCSYGYCYGSHRPCPVGRVESDTKVKASLPDTNYGASATLEADRGPTYPSWSLLKLSLTGLGEDHLSRAYLTLVPTGGSIAGGRIRTVSCDWDPTTVTWNTKPAPGLVLPRTSIGLLVSGKPVKVDVSSVFGDADGTACVLIDNPKGDATYASLESKYGRPQLAIETGCLCAKVDATAKTDATVASDAPTARLGFAKTLIAGSTPESQIFFRVKVGGLAGRAVSSARLRLRAVSDGGASDSGGRIRQVPAEQCGLWHENSITWASRPTSVGPVLSSVAGTVVPGKIVEFDLKSTITGDGSYCYRIDSPSAYPVTYHSSQSLDYPSRPTLILVLAP